MSGSQLFVSWASRARGVSTCCPMVVGKEAWEEAKPVSGPRISQRSLRPTHSEALTVSFKGLAISPTVGITGGGSTTLRTRNALIDEITHVIREVAVPKVRQEMIDQSPGPRGAFEYVGRKQA